MSTVSLLVVVMLPVLSRYHVQREWQWFEAQMLTICHLWIGLQLYVHWIHKGLVIFSLVFLVVLVISIEEVWNEEWDILVVSLRVTAPFLHVGAVLAFSFLSWLFANVFMRSRRLCARMMLLVVYLLPLLGLYLLPLMINSPCILLREQLQPRPRIIAHRGASMVAPENTLMAFERAMDFGVYGLESDVMLSTDGIPFLMHDSDLRRTTNVAMVFPDRAADRADSFNWTELQRLNAGHWFLEEDPFGSAHQLSSAERQYASSQSLPNLAGLLRIAAKGNASVLFDLRQPPADHPFRKLWVNTTVDVVLASALPQDLMLWLPWEHRDVVRMIAPRFQQVSGEKEPPERLHEQRYVMVNLRFTDLAPPDICGYARSNISTNAYTVDAVWLFSLLWCAGVTSVTTNAAHLFSSLQQPTWLLTPEQYRTLWILTDVISIFIVIVIFRLHRWRFSTLRRMDPEHVALSTVVRRCNRDVNTMKKKLIFFDDDLMVSDDTSYVDTSTAAAIDTSYVGDEIHIDGDRDY
uniref:glycerophosphodiester phosphodiesterase domain-containing protein 5 isoform X2 n=1 Tax=Myxine glutinosa TaxID=7769 RepID=UPI00358FCECC